MLYYDFGPLFNSKTKHWCAPARAQEIVACAQGLSNFAPVPTKSGKLRVTTVKPCSTAAAAIIASDSLRVSAPCIAAMINAASSLNGKMRPANAARIPVSQALKSLPCGGPRRSGTWIPFSSSSQVLADKYNCPTCCPAAQAAPHATG